MKNSAVEVNKVSKSFERLKALDRVSLNIKEHSITGLLGPNGSGKSTLIRSILGLIFPDSGTIDILGKSPSEIEKKLISYLPENLGLYGNMTVTEEILFWLNLKDISRQEALLTIGDYLAFLEIESCASKRISQLSKGQQQRVALIIALASNPRFLVLDEPFSGLDPIGMDLMSMAIKAANENGTTILISTHMVEYVGNICSDLCFINKGVILECDSTMNITNFYKNIKVKFSKSVASEDVARYFPGVAINLLDGEITIPDSPATREVLKSMGTMILEVENLKPNFRDIFKILNERQN